MLSNSKDHFKSDNVFGNGLYNKCFVFLFLDYSGPPDDCFLIPLNSEDNSSKFFIFLN